MVNGGRRASGGCFIGRFPWGGYPRDARDVFLDSLFNPLLPSRQPRFSFMAVDTIISAASERLDGLIYLRTSSRLNLPDVENTGRTDGCIADLFRDEDVAGTASNGKYLMAPFKLKIYE